MTESREYQESDKFKRFLLRQIRAGKNLAARGWEGDMMPLDLQYASGREGQVRRVQE